MSEMTTRQSTITSYGLLVSVWRNKHMLEEFWRLTNAPELDPMSRQTCVTFYDVVALLCAPLSISRSLLWYLQCVVITGHSHQHSQFNKSLSPKYDVVTHWATIRDTLLFLQSPPPLLSIPHATATPTSTKCIKMLYLGRNVQLKSPHPPILITKFVLSTYQSDVCFL